MATTNTNHAAQPFGSIPELTQRNVDIVAELEAAAHAERSRSDIVADAVSGFCGSMPFYWINAAWFSAWIGWNTIPGFRHFDPFPFSFLTLMVSLEAIFLSIFILISQNRQQLLADRRNHFDMQINLLAEQENSAILVMLRQIMERLGISHEDQVSRTLEEPVDPARLITQIQETIEQPRDSSGETPGQNTQPPPVDAPTA